jgi:hypothetical protein
VCVKLEAPAQYLLIEVTKFKFGGSFGMSLEGDCNEFEVTLNLESFVTFGMSLEGVCREFET